jgi:hypothetical protein
MKKVGSYGSGFLTRIKRAAGDVLAYRWHDDGRERKKILGPVSTFKSEGAAWKEVDRLRLGRKGNPETVEQLSQHWKEKESSRRAFSTSETISGYLTNWVVPAWGSRLLNEVKAVDVEDWLAKFIWHRVARRRFVTSCIFFMSTQSATNSRSAIPSARFVRVGSAWEHRRDWT